LAVGFLSHYLAHRSQGQPDRSVAAGAPQRRTSSAAAATVTASPTAAAAPQEAARLAAANILRGAIALDSGLAVTCLAHQAYRDTLAGCSRWAAGQELDEQQLGRKDSNSDCESSSNSSTPVAEVTPVLTTFVDATTDSVVDKRLRLVWTIDEHSRRTQRAALVV